MRVSAAKGRAKKIKEPEKSAVAIIAPPAKIDFTLIGPPSEVVYFPFSAVRESVLSYDSTSGPRSVEDVSRSWGLASLMQALKRIRICKQIEKQASIIFACFIGRLAH